MQGSVPAPIGALIIGRDVVLIFGSCLDRLRSVGWRWPGTAKFFSVSVGTAPSAPQGEDASGPPAPQSQASCSGSCPLSRRPLDQQGSQAGTAVPTVPPSEHSRWQTAGPPAGPAPHGTAPGLQAVPPAKLVQPLMISKVNTVFQMALIGGCVSNSLLAWPPEGSLWVLGGLTAATTCASGALYLRMYLKSGT